MGEEWRPVPGFEDLYEVSDRGRVRSIERETPAGRRGGTIKSPGRAGRGYPQAHLWKEGERYARYVHDLVLEAFRGPRPEGHQASHLDGDLENNRSRTSRGNDLRRTWP